MDRIVTNSKLFNFSKRVHPIKSYDHFCAAIRSCSGLPNFVQEACTAFTPINLIRRETPQNGIWVIVKLKLSLLVDSSFSHYVFCAYYMFSVNIFTSNFEASADLRRAKFRETKVNWLWRIKIRLGKSPIAEFQRRSCLQEAFREKINDTIVSGAIYIALLGILVSRNHELVNGISNGNWNVGKLHMFFLFFGNE